MAMVLGTGILLTSPTHNVADLPPTRPAVVDGGPEGEAEGAEAGPRPPVQNHNFDPEFYFNGGFVVFEVEDYLFRVPTYIFAKEANYFITEFNILAEDALGTERTIVLPSDIRRDNFRTFLKVLYRFSISSTLTLTVSEWSSVLKLSTKWKFKNLMEMAITHLTSLPSGSFQPLDKIILGRQCSVLAWFVAGLEEIVTRDETIGDDEAIKMDHIMAFRLSRLRERRLQRALSTWSYASQIAEDIQCEFAAEIASIKAEEQLLRPKANPVHVYPSTSTLSKKAKGKKR